MNNMYIAIVLLVLVVGLFVVFKFSPPVQFLPTSKPAQAQNKTFDLVVLIGVGTRHFRDIT
jgi:hypothetical protein